MSITEEQVIWLVEAITKISHGRTFSTNGEKLHPLGLEALGMAIEGAGEPGCNPLSSAIRDSGMAIATAIDGLADTIRETRKDKS